MPSTVSNERPVNDGTKAKLLQESDNSNASPANEWITGGPIGSKNAVLVFKTSALFRDVIDDDEMDHKPSTSDGAIKENCRFPPVAVTKPKSSRKTTNVKKTLSTIFSNERNHLSKGKSDPLSSSSENSISSACDDPTDLEADIVKAEKSAGDGKKHNIRFSGNKSKSNSKSTNEKKDEKSTKGRLIPVNSEKSVADDGDTQAKIDEMPAKLLNIAFKFTNTEKKLLKRILSSHGLKEVKDNQNFNLLWTGSQMKPDILMSLKPYQRVNHFPRSYELTRKDRLYKNIEKMQHWRGIKHFDIVPLSFMLPFEYRSLVQAHRSGHRGPWIVKPAASSRGRGIYLVNTPEQIQLEDQVIVSKYIADPLCIDGHKCDVRLYVAVTSFDPLLIYLYEEGLVRLATVKYDKTAENLWNPCIHLCNYSVNKYHSDYIKAREGEEDVGHKWTFSALLRHLKSQGRDTTSLMLAIEDLIIKSIFACSQSIISAMKMFMPHQNNNCFELYGFDVLIDSTLKPWLLEVNLSPSLNLSTPLDVKVKSAMLTDLLNLAGIPALSPLTQSGTDYKMSGSRFKSAAATMPSSVRGHDSSTNMGTSSLNRRLYSGLSAEENRVLRNARTQNSRRGGFVRIFPAQDSMQRFGMFLDCSTGIPVSTSTSMLNAIQGHNLNQMLYNQFFGNCSKSMKENCIDERMKQYERALYSIKVDSIFKENPPKSSDDARRLRKQLHKAMENGNELTLLQARKIFATFLECILKRLSQEPKNQHEKLILKFITRSDFSIKPPSFMKNPYTAKIDGKDRSAIVAKLLGDYLEAFNRETEACIDNYSYYGLISSQLVDDFIAQAQECDLDSILALHVNMTQNLSFLYGRCSTQINIPATPPPIPTGSNGFLKALPSMAPNIATRDMASIDLYYKSLCPVSSDIEREIDADKSSNKLTKNRLSYTAIYPTKKRSVIA